jgi:preprotein translocase subunit SecE
VSPRVVAFLRACWAELQRVQWPDRRQTTQLTAIVLVFIVIMGGYLGLLDAIVSRVVQEII